MPLHGRRRVALEYTKSIKGYLVAQEAEHCDILSVSKQDDPCSTCLGDGASSHDNIASGAAAISDENRVDESRTNPKDERCSGGYNDTLQVRGRRLCRMGAAEDEVHGRGSDHGSHSLLGAKLTPGARVNPPTNTPKEETSEEDRHREGNEGIDGRTDRVDTVSDTLTLGGNGSSGSNCEVESVMSSRAQRKQEMKYKGNTEKLFDVFARAQTPEGTGKAARLMLLHHEQLTLWLRGFYDKHGYLKNMPGAPTGEAKERVTCSYCRKGAAFKKCHQLSLTCLTGHEPRTECYVP